ncbi:hypothetical protein JCGZ_19434 [Jatropha curcas]|uniref:Uncharacterized protein n=1 Tax=Jatropha curcas TaxID=180498 RepID=A0A067LJG0_JATCU|nr:hypothetical protein JCGZ_19434 [Jatropha curcas]
MEHVVRNRKSGDERGDCRAHFGHLENRSRKTNAKNGLLGKNRARWRGEHLVLSCHDFPATVHGRWWQRSGERPARPRETEFSSLRADHGIVARFLIVGHHGIVRTDYCWPCMGRSAPPCAPTVTDTVNHRMAACCCALDNLDLIVARRVASCCEHMMI